MNKLDFIEDRDQLLNYSHKGEQETDLQTVGRPALILLEMNWPDKGGWQLLQDIKANTRLRPVPIVILSTSKETKDIYRAYDMGANSFINKPPILASLVEIMNTLHTYWFETVELLPTQSAREWFLGVDDPLSERNETWL